MTEGRIVYNSTLKFIEQNRTWLQDDSIAKLLELNNHLDIAIKSEDKQVINLKLEDLNAYSRPLAEEALDRVVEDNLSGTCLHD